MKHVTIEYDPKNNTVYIDANEKDFVPKYLDYALEHLGLPKNVKRIFKNNTATQTPTCTWCEDTVNFHAYNNVFRTFPNFCPECGRKMTKE